MVVVDLFGVEDEHTVVASLRLGIAEQEQSLEDINSFRRLVVRECQQETDVERERQAVGALAAVVFLVRTAGHTNELFLHRDAAALDQHQLVGHASCVLATNIDLTGGIDLVLVAGGCEHHADVVRIDTVVLGRSHATACEQDGGENAEDGSQSRDQFHKVLLVVEVVIAWEQVWRSCAWCRRRRNRRRHCAACDSRPSRS